MKKKQSDKAREGSCDEAVGEIKEVGGKYTRKALSHPYFYWKGKKLKTKVK